MFWVADLRTFRLKLVRVFMIISTLKSEFQPNGSIVIVTKTYVQCRHRVILHCTKHKDFRQTVFAQRVTLRRVLATIFEVEKQLSITYFESVCSLSSASYGRTTYQPELTTFLQPRHIPKQGYNITQSSAPDDGHMVARNMLSNY